MDKPNYPTTTEQAIKLAAKVALRNVMRKIDYTVSTIQLDMALHHLNYMESHGDDPEEIERFQDGPLMDAKCNFDSAEHFYNQDEAIRVWSSGYVLDPDRNGGVDFKYFIEYNPMSFDFSAVWSGEAGEYYIGYGYPSFEEAIEAVHRDENGEVIDKAEPLPILSQSNAAAEFVA